jgi:hypothetical protein
MEELGYNMADPPDCAEHVVVHAFSRSLRPVPTSAKGNAYDYRARHMLAWRQPRGTERSIVAMLRSLALYVDDYSQRFEGSKVGADYVLGEAWADMLRGFRALLNGELGRLDGGALDAACCDLWAYAGFKEEL